MAGGELGDFAPLVVGLVVARAVAPVSSPSARGGNGPRDEGVASWT